MTILNIEEQAFKTMMARFDDFARRVGQICQTNGDKSLKQWLDNQDVCVMLNISPRTLQTYRDNGTIGYTQIGHKMYYRPDDVMQLLKRE